MTENSPETDIEILLKDLNDLVKNAGHPNAPTILEAIKAKHEIAKLHSEQERWKLDRALIVTQEENADRRSADNYQANLFSEGIGLAKIALNTLVIVNAGAVLVILNFFSNVVKADCLIKNIEFIENFVLATIAVILAAIFGFIAQMCFIELPEKWRDRVGSFIRFIAVALVFCSLFHFGKGSHEAIKTFSSNAMISCPEADKEKSKSQS